MTISDDSLINYGSLSPGSSLLTQKKQNNEQKINHALGVSNHHHPPLWAKRKFHYFKRQA